MFRIRHTNAPSRVPRREKARDLATVVDASDHNCNILSALKFVFFFFFLMLIFSRRIKYLNTKRKFFFFFVPRSISYQSRFSPTPLDFIFLFLAHVIWPNNRLTTAKGGGGYRSCCPNEKPFLAACLFSEILAKPSTALRFLNLRRVISCGFVAAAAVVAIAQKQHTVGADSN